MYLNGCVVDYVETLEAAGFKFENPNVKSTCGCGSSFSAVYSRARSCPPSPRPWPGAFCCCNLKDASMKALLLSEYKHLAVADLPAPVPGAGEVLIRVAACGICGSDVHGYDGTSGRRIPPIVMGHEAAGVVAAVGAGVTGYRVGDRVTFDSTVYCGECEFCRRGEVNLCDRSPGRRRLLRRLSPRRRVRRICNRSGAYSVSPAGQSLFLGRGDARGRLGCHPCGASCGDRRRRDSAGDRRRHDRPAHPAGGARFSGCARVFITDVDATGWNWRASLGADAHYRQLS